MSALKIYAVWILLHLFSQVCYCQSQDFAYVSFRGVSLANHSYVDLSLVNNTASGSVQCHTDLSTCCTSAQGPHRGDWYFPNGSRLQLRSGGGDKIYQSREAQRVDLRRRNYNGTASGIYNCSIPTVAVHGDTDPSVREYVYVGLYNSGGDISITDTLDFDITTNDDANTLQFTLTCISTGGPATTVTWTRDSDDTVTEGTETVLHNSVTAQYIHTLTVTGREGGLYTCTVANNKPSSDSSSLTVKVASAPADLSLKQDGESAILVSWTTPTPLGNTTGYRVYYTTDSMTKNITINAISTMLSLTSLVPGHHYNISIVGLSEHLPSEPVNSSIILSPLPRDISVTVKTVTTTTIPLRVEISNYNLMTDYNMTIAWNQTSCDDGAGIKDLFEGQYNTIPRITYTIRVVYPGGDYSIRVTITNVAGSVTSDIVNVSTITTVPSAPPKNIMIDNTTVFTITLKWEPVDCMYQNGKITEYIIQYHKQDRENETMNDTTAMLEFTITDLQPYTVYVIGVAAVNDAGIGVYSNVTAETIPFEVAVRSKTSTTITLAWSEADYTAMKTVNISWMIDDSLCMYDEDVDGQTTNNTVAPYVITELKAHSSYIITVCVEDLVCKSITETTRESVPSAAPANVLLVTQTVSSITVTWEPVPCMHRNGDITGYAVMYRELSSDLATYIHETVTIRNIDITGLKPSTLYEIAVAAFNSVATGPFTNASFKTDTLDTTGPLSSVTATPNVPTASGDEKTSSSNTGGVVAGVVVSLLVIIGATIGIIVAVLWIQRRRQSEKGVFPTSHFNIIPKRFSTRQSIKMSENLELDEKPIGEGLYSEVPDVVPTVRPHSKLLYCESGDSAKSDNQLVTDEAKPLVPATEKESDEDDSKSQEESDEGDEVKEKAAPSVPELEPIPVALFGSHVENCHSSNNQPFMKEFESLIDGEGKSISIARSSKNRKKNRFANISAYDDNRVILNAMEGYESDYINASYVDGYSTPKKFIAAQGPLPSTLVDFWRMVWQERVPTVVMITNLVEGKKTKCEQYWPSTGSQDFGPFHVTITDQLILADYTIRTLTVELSGKTRKVTHFHYTGWPDHGVPDYATSILTLHKKVMKDHKTLRGRPILVHCSAGVGRTGTFITIDHVLEQREKEEVVDIAGVIQRLRQQRTKIVQTVDQYIFIHDAVLESVTCGDTQIEAGILRKALAQLQNRDETGSTGLDLQLSVGPPLSLSLYILFTCWIGVAMCLSIQILDQVSINPDEAKVFTARNNQAKNRSSHYLPVDKCRVVLKGETPDYIHASSIHGYKQQRAFIIAQGPMKSTSRDFWKMIFSRKCSVIVMLSDLCEQGEEVCYQYWPGQRAQSYGEFRIELINEDKYNGYVLRTFSLQQAKFSKPHQVHQFQITNWISDHKCADKKTLVTVIDKVSKVQRRTGNNAVVVHGINTVSRSAIFCAATTTIERCKTEGVVDVFQVVKAMRAQKPGAIQSVEQYRSIYEAVLVFLASFESYSNFTLQQKPVH